MASAFFLCDCALANSGVFANSRGLLQHLSEGVAPLVHGFAGRIVLGGVDLNRFAANRAIVLCLWETGYTVTQRGSLFSDRQRQRSDAHNGILSPEIKTDHWS